MEEWRESRSQEASISGDKGPEYQEAKAKGPRYKEAKRPAHLEERGGGGGRLALEEDVDGLGYGVAELVAAALLPLTALRVLAVTQPI